MGDGTGKEKGSKGKRERKLLRESKIKWEENHEGKWKREKGQGKGLRKRVREEKKEVNERKRKGNMRKGKGNERKRES